MQRREFRLWEKIEGHPTPFMGKFQLDFTVAMV
jgi:hypothetical protein